MKGAQICGSRSCKHVALSTEYALGILFMKFQVYNHSS